MKFKELKKHTSGEYGFNANWFIFYSCINYKRIENGIL